jgi:hypothetical protein
VELNNYFTNSLLFLTVLLSPLFTIGSSSPEVNFNIAFLQFFLTLPIIGKQHFVLAKNFVKSVKFLITSLIILLWLLVWDLQGVEIIENTRLFVYFVQAFFLFGFINRSYNDNSSTLKIFFYAKVIAVIFSAIYIFYTLWKFHVPNFSCYFPILPVFRNIRHFNYEVFALSVMSVIFLVGKPTDKSLLYFILLFFCGGLCIWSRCRAQLITFLVFVSVFYLLQNARRMRIDILKSLFVFALGYGFVSGLDSNLLTSMIDRSIHPVNNIYSRTDLWGALLEYISESYISLIFGLGPDALVNSYRFPGTVQAHNIFLQVLIEFGIIGICVFIWFNFKIFNYTNWQTIRCSSSNFNKGIYSVLPAIFIYCLVDGYLYHGSAVLIVMIMISFILRATTVKGA